MFEVPSKRVNFYFWHSHEVKRGIMGNVLSKKDVKASQGHIMDQVKLIFRKVQALTHPKSGQMDRDKE